MSGCRLQVELMGQGAQRTHLLWWGRGSAQVWDMRCGSRYLERWSRETEDTRAAYGNQSQSHSEAWGRWMEAARTSPCAEGVGVVGEGSRAHPT